MSVFVAILAGGLPLRSSSTADSLSDAIQTGTPLASSAPPYCGCLVHHQDSTHRALFALVQLLSGSATVSLEVAPVADALALGPVCSSS
jgi:hypothetical protein